jgi:hypothetical protein
VNDASNGVENDSSDGSIEIEFEDSDSVDTVAEEANPDSSLSVTKDVKASTKAYCAATVIPVAEEEDHCINDIAFTRPPQLLPPSIDSLVAAKAAIAAQSRPTHAAIISQHGGMRV